MPAIILRAILLLTATILATAVQAQKPAEPAFPTRPVRILVAQAAGGPTDVVARIYGTRLSEIQAQQAVVDNRPGAGGSVAGDITSRAPADGYTLMVAANGTLSIAPHFIKLTYDARKDLVPVGLIGNSPLGLMVYPQLPAATFKDLIALAKSRPGKINFGSSGMGATSHLAGEFLKMLSGINIVHVPYKGAGPALVALMSGEIDMLISGLSSGLPYVKQKQVRLLAVSSAKRVSILPDVPSMAETLPGYDVTSWYAVLAPAGTPRAIVDKLNQMSNATVSTPDVKSKLATLGVEVETLSPEQLSAKMLAEYDRWGKVVQSAGMKQK